VAAHLRISWATAQRRHASALAKLLDLLVEARKKKDG